MLGQHGRFGVVAKADACLAGTQQTVEAAPDLRSVPARAILSLQRQKRTTGVGASIDARQVKMQEREKRPRLGSIAHRVRHQKLAQSERLVTQVLPDHLTLALRTVA